MTTQPTKQQLADIEHIKNQTLSTERLNEYSADLFTKRPHTDANFKYYEAASMLSKLFSPICLQFRDVTKEGKRLFIYENGIYVDATEFFEQTLLYLGENIPKKKSRECVYDILMNIPSNKRYQEDLPSKCTQANFKNCIVDISGENPVRLPHSPENTFFTQIPNNFNDESECDIFDEYLKNTLEEKYHKFIYEWIGYCLFESYELQYILFLHGAPRAGKSTLQRLIDRIVGDENSSSLSLEQMNTEPHSTAALIGKLVNNAGEVNYSDLKKGAGVLNQLSGGDPISVNPKYKAMYTFINTARLIFSMNHLPKIYGDSDGFYRRVKRVEYKKEMTLDEMTRYYDKKTGLFSQGCVDGIISRAVRAYHALTQRGALDFSMESDSVEEVESRYQVVSDHIAEFVYDCVTTQDRFHIDRDNAQFTTNAEIYDIYIEWCDINGIIPKKYTSVFNSRSLSVALKEAGGLKATHGNVRGWDYVMLSAAANKDGHQETLDTSY